MKPAHFLNLRWKQDYRFVTELRGRGVGPLEQLGLRLQQSKPDPWTLYEETLTGVGEVITLFGRMFLKFDGRRAVWQHSLIYPLGTLDRAAARGIFLAVYGGDPGRLLPVLYELLAPLEHWEGDPLARRMFLGATMTLPEPVAATLIRELWSSRPLPEPERSAQLDTLRSLVVGTGAAGVLDEPTPEEREALTRAQRAEEPAGSDPPPSGRGLDRDEPPPVPTGLMFTSGEEWPRLRDPGEDAEALKEHVAQTGPVAEELLHRSTVAYADLEVDLTSAEPLQPQAPQSEELPELSGLSHIDAAGLDIGGGWPSLSREASDFPEAVFRPPTEELELQEEEELELEHSASADSDPAPVEPALADPVIPAWLMAPSDRSRTAQLQHVELHPALYEDDEEDDDKTVISPPTRPSTGAARPSAAPLPAAAPLPSALSEAETRLNIPVPTAAQLASLTAAPPAPPSAPPPSPLSAPPAPPDSEGPLRPVPNDEMKRPLIIGGLVGLVTALLALWIVWARSTHQEEALGGPQPPKLGEQAEAPPSAPPPPPAVAATNDVVGVGEPPKGAAAAGVDCYPDDDEDGFGRKDARAERHAGSGCPERWAPKEGDCADTDIRRYPGARELCDDVINDCERSKDIFRDDDNNNQLDCTQDRFGPHRLTLEFKPIGYEDSPHQHLQIDLRLPTVESGKSVRCRPELVLHEPGHGPRKAYLEYGRDEWKCGVPAKGKSLPDGIKKCFKDEDGRVITLADTTGKVNVDATCCFQNIDAYDEYERLGSRALDAKRLESCGYWSSGADLAPIPY